MTDISTNNLNSHYSNQSKITQPSPIVASAPNILPTYHLFNDKDADDRFEVINGDIHTKTKAEKTKDGKNFFKYYLAFVAALLAFLGIKKIFK